MLLATLVVSLATAAPAGAFIGEESVLDGAGDLTAPAKSILEKPTFLAENVGEAAVYGGAEEAGAAAGVLEGGGILPALGPGVLAFGVGAGVGTALCNIFAIWEECLTFDSLTADPAEPDAEAYPEGKGWKFSQPGYSGGPEYAWYWNFSSSSYVHATEGYGANKCSSHWAAPTGLTAYIVVNKKTCEGSEPYTEVTLWRSSMENREVGTAPDATGRFENGYEAPSNWSEETAAQLEGHEGDAAGRVGEKIASEIEGSKVADPYKTEVTVPETCEVGTKRATCLVELEELELVPETTELDWEDAVVKELEELEPEKSREKESERIIEIVPPPGTNVETGSEIVVVTNPGVEDMPEYVPAPDKSGGSDGEGEDEEEYKKRLAPIFLPDVGTLGDAAIDPSVGPDAVSKTSPDSKHRFDPKGEHAVKIWVNPADAPAPAGAWSPPGLDSIDASPLSGLKPCGVFPFGLFCWLGEAFGQFNTTGVCPHAAVPTGIGGDFELGLCGTTSETVMSYVRPFILLAFIVGCGFLFARGTTAVGGG